MQARTSSQCARSLLQEPLGQAAPCQSWLHLVLPTRPVGTVQQPGSEGTRGGTSWGTLWGIWDRSGGGQPCSSFPQCVLARSVPPVVTGTRGRDFNVPDGNFFVALGSKSCMLGTCGTPNLNPPPGFFPPVPPSVPARPCAPRGAAPAGCPLCPSREVSHLPNP